MSDVAVTWAKAQECVDAKGNKDRNAKQTLVHLASYVDASGEGWAAVSVLALEMDVSERSVQRGLSKLKAMRLIKETGRSRVYDKRVFPIYSLPLDTGHANTMHRLAAEREAARGDAGVTPRTAVEGENGARNGGNGTENGSETYSRGDVGVTPTGSTGDNLSPRDVAFVTPRGDTGVTQIGKINTQGFKNPSRVCAREAAIRAWGEKAPDKVAPRHAERAWLSAIERSGLTDDRLLAAVLVAVARDTAFDRGMAKNLDRWLDEDRYEPWLSVEPQEPLSMASDVWAGPADVAIIVTRTMGPDAVTAYLGKAQWDGSRRMVQVATDVALERLSGNAGRALKASGIGVERMAGGGARHG